MHVTPTLTSAAMERWQRISTHSKELILNSIFCGSCESGHQIRDATGKLDPSGDIILYGLCVDCGGKVCRVVSTGETMGRATSS